MNGRDFLVVARVVVIGTTAAHWRTVSGRAYYGLMLEGREALRRWGFPVPVGDRVHRFVRLTFTYAADPDLHDLGLKLDHLVQLRNKADYDLGSALFANSRQALRALDLANDGLAKLDAVDADPARRSAAIADIGSRPLP
jgi:hypothetical protein